MSALSITKSTLYQLTANFLLSHAVCRHKQTELAMNLFFGLPNFA